MVAWKDSEQERRDRQPALFSPSSAHASALLGSCSAGFAGQVESFSLPSSGGMAA